MPETLDARLSELTEHARDNARLAQAAELRARGTRRNRRRRGGAALVGTAAVATAVSLGVPLNTATTSPHVTASARTGSAMLTSYQTAVLAKAHVTTAAVAALARARLSPAQIDALAKSRLSAAQIAAQYAARRAVATQVNWPDPDQRRLAIASVRGAHLTAAQLAALRRAGLTAAQIGALQRAKISAAQISALAG
jgi:hypothetical protein